jgi:hypothetical protein
VGVFFYKDIYCEMKDLIRHILREHTREIKEQSKFKNYDINDESFANLFNYFLIELKNNVGYSHSKMKKGFMLTVRAWSGKPPKIISKKVLDHFIENHPNVNPFKANHRPRNKYGIDVIFEHTTPVNNFMKQLISSKNLEEIKNVMRNYSGLCIISLDEDRCLFTSGLSRQRPEGWEQAYASCGIEVMTEAEYDVYKTQKLNSTEDETTD